MAVWRSNQSRSNGGPAPADSTYIRARPDDAGQSEERMPNPITSRHLLCNAYCSPAEHCDLLFITPGVGREGIRAGLAPAVFVTRAEPAREPPSVEGQPLVTIVPDDCPEQCATAPWLVWWRADYRAAMREFKSWPARWPAQE